MPDLVRARLLVREGRRRIRRMLGQDPLALRQQGQRMWIIDHLPSGSVFAEVGVWQGDLSEELLEYLDPRLLHLIDPWVATNDETHKGATYNDGPSQATMDQMAESVAHRFADRMRSGQVIVHRGRSVDVAADIEDGSLDWAYIDGADSYEAVRADLTIFSRRVKLGGSLVGDDYGLGWWGRGVIDAVDEFVEDGQHTLAIKGRQFMIHL